MTKILSSRATIRQVVIDGMEVEEVRSLIYKVQEALDSDILVDVTLFEEYVGEVITARYGEAEE